MAFLSASLDENRRCGYLTVRGPRTYTLASRLLTETISLNLIVFQHLTVDASLSHHDAHGLGVSRRFGVAFCFARRHD